MLASGSRVGRSHTPQDCCVRFAVVVTFHAATLATGRALPLTRTGLSPVGTGQLSCRTKDGRLLSRNVDCVPSNPSHPVTRDALEAKFCDCVFFAAVSLVPKNID